MVSKLVADELPSILASGEFNDVDLHYRNGRAPLKLHALVISQSPALLQELRYAQQTSPQSGSLNIYFSLEEHDEVSDGEQAVHFLPALH